jgi:Mitochondrial biogenesis AIM24/Tetratricopeptide repeat
MREPSPRAPFDQGLFLAHFNKGKGFFEQRQFEEAEGELEEAYLLRPRDQRVLNLLGLVYFKQDKLEKAEEVYRKLAAESPDAHTLYYNLGLIYFKLNRLDEAESAFLKALDLARDNPKINFYLGSIYERLHRFQDAIYQYRQAGANLMVRRVEDKIAAHTPRVRVASPPPISATVKRDDTAEFKAREVQEKVRRKAEEALGPVKTVGPVSPRLLADNAPKETGDTARFQLAEVAAAAAARTSTSATAPAVARLPEIISFPKPPAASTTGQTLPPRPTETFRFLENNLMEVEVAGKVFIRQGTIYSYSGNLTFWVKDPRPGGHPALVIITGIGKVILTDKDREITFMQIHDETVFIEPGHILACEESLTPRYLAVGEGAGAFEVLALEGRGMVALSVASKPLALTVTPDLPVSVPSASIITWSGSVEPRIVDDRQLYEVMLPPHRRNGALIRLEGTGRLLVEQHVP